jgi:transposase
MAAHAKRIEIASEDRPVLEKWANARVAERRLVDRAQIVLAAGEGRPASEIAERVGCGTETAKRWRARYEQNGLDGLRDSPKSGRPPTHGADVRARLIALACTRPPDTAEGLRRERWRYEELAEQVGMSVSRAYTILAEADLRPHLTEQWVMSELGPEFDAQAAEVCGLYVDPPQNAIVVSVTRRPRSPLGSRPGRTRLLSPAGPPAATASTSATAPRTCLPPCRCTPARSRA